ncbi:MAG: UDP-N-acetylmuramoyl-tripeptide--D-alanyl-D-alanine ligase [Alphaproteobacteria bacterium]
MTQQRPLWLAEDAAAATNGTIFNGDDWAATGVSIDSRTVKEGDLFIAIKGENFDGHDYVKKAFEQGAVAAIVERNAIDASVPLLVVKDCQIALESLAAFARERFQGKVIAITGSVGKTSVKEGLRAVLGSFGNTYATEGNLNNHIGAPLSLARLPAHFKYGVFELGMSNAGELRALTRQVLPDLAVVTNINASHQEFFPDLKAIAEAKAEIFEAVSTEGTVFFNADTDFAELLQTRAEQLGIQHVFQYGKSGYASLLKTAQDGRGTKISAEIDGTKIDYKISTQGTHFVTNTLCLMGIVNALGLALVDAGKVIEHLSPPKGRGEISEIPLKSGGLFTLIDDSYNANPTSMKAALNTLSLKKPEAEGRRIAVLGKMLELGEKAAEYHAEVGHDVARSNIDAVFTVGALMMHLNKVVPAEKRKRHSETIEGVTERLLAFLQPNDVLLVKGSHGSDVWKLVEELKHP